jgi:hypothetical protein
MDISRLARRISRGEFRDNALEKQQLRPDFNQSVAVNSRKRSKRRGPLTTSEKVDIVHRVLISYEKHAEIAREYRVTNQVIAHLMMKAKKNKQFLQELFEQRDQVAARREIIQSHVEGLNARREVIDSAAHVIKSLYKEHPIKTTEQEVRDVMRKELGMRYRKIKQVSLHSNSEKNLVLRQRWALEFLAQARKKKIFLNIDETWLGMSDFRRMKWQVPGTTNSVAKLEVAPRITVILGLDSLGNVYLSLA